MIEVPLSVKADDEIKFLPSKFTLYERVLVVSDKAAIWRWDELLAWTRVGSTLTHSPSWREKHAKGGLGGSVETYLWQPGRTRRRECHAPCVVRLQAWRRLSKRRLRLIKLAYSLERSLPTIDLIFYGGRTRSQWWERERRGDRENEHQWRPLYFQRVADISTLGMNRSIGRQEINFDLDQLQNLQSLP